MKNRDLLITEEVEKRVRTEAIIPFSELKSILVNAHPDYFWNRAGIKNALLNCPSLEVSIEVVDSKEVFKIRRIKKPTKAIGKNAMLKLIKESKGKIFTITFIKKDNSLRTINCRFKSVDDLGYIIVQEIKTKELKKVNIQTIKNLKIYKTNFVCQR